jgi:Protein of unknown function (DUF3800)
MATFLFVDESGYDAGNSPYGVLGAVAIEDRELWSIVKDVQAAELNHFGTAYSSGARELKAKKLLNRKVFQHAEQMPPIPLEERRIRARECLQRGEQAGLPQITALAQAKLAYVLELLEICARFRCKAFASIVNKASPTPGAGHLRKDYAYLFERFYYFLEDLGPSSYGVVVFDELDKVQSHLLVDQMDGYFQADRPRTPSIRPDFAGAVLRT